jgi:hypothetical protein
MGKGGYEMAVKTKKATKSRILSKKEFDAALKRMDAHIKSIDASFRKIRAIDKKMAPDLEALKKLVEDE